MENKSFTLMRVIEDYCKRNINGADTNAALKVLCPNQDNVVPLTVNRLNTGRYSITDAYQVLEPLLG